MKFGLKKLFVSAIFLAGSAWTQAATISVNFADYAFGGDRSDITTAANNLYAASYGVTLSNVFLSTYGGGEVFLANGTVANWEQHRPTDVGRIDFLHGADSVTFGFSSIHATNYQAFTATGTLVGSHMSRYEDWGTATFASAGEKIAYLSFESTSGLGFVDALRYDTSAAPVPEPETYAMFLVGLGLMGAVARRRKQV